MTKLHSLINEIIETMPARMSRQEAVTAVKNGLARQAKKSSIIILEVDGTPQKFPVSELKEIWSSIK